MTEPANGTVTVLEMLRTLYDVGGVVGDEADRAWASIVAQDIDGVHEDEEPFYLMAGTVIRLLLRHAEADVDEMFAAARIDLQELGPGVGEYSPLDVEAIFNQADRSSGGGRGEVH